MFMFQSGFESGDFSLAAATAVVFFLIVLVVIGDRLPGLPRASEFQALR